LEWYCHIVDGITALIVVTITTAGAGFSSPYTLILPAITVTAILLSYVKIPLVETTV
jgi:hypothetical protein